MFDVPAILAITGAVAFLVGLFGGGIEVKEFKLPQMTTWLRLGSIVIGVVLIVAAVMLSSPNLARPAPTPQMLVPTAVPPTDTPEPTPTPKPTHTPEPTSAPTLPPETKIPTRVPSPTPKAALDLSDVALTTKDFPAGFKEMSPAAMGLDLNDLKQGNFSVESLFAFMNTEDLQFVMGLTTMLATETDQKGFDVALQQPDFLMKSMGVGMGNVDVSGQKEIPGMKNIGSASVGLTMAVDMQGLSMRFDIVMMRRDQVGAMIMTMYPIKAKPLVSIGDAARMLDQHIVEVLARSD